VEDSGPGIPTDAASRIFEPFYTTKPFHMGLGLSIARSICRAHGGDMWAEHGARFHCALPITERDGT
jgi:signal transduction histidine kinase